MKPDAFLALEDGTVLRGRSCGAPVDRFGEVVFNTGMTGYEEILTDPSYAGQIVTFTVPELGNTGFNRADRESAALHASGMICRNLNAPSSWRSEETLPDVLRRSGIPAISGIDTRSLTLRLRSGGTLKARICCSGNETPEAAIAAARAWPGLDGQDYAAAVTCPAPYDWPPEPELPAPQALPDGFASTGETSTGNPSTGGTGASPVHPLQESPCLANPIHSSCTRTGEGARPPSDDAPFVAVLDFGIKYNTLRALAALGARVRVFPAKTPATDLLAAHPDGLLLSNGPADPAALPYAVETIRALLGKLPIMGICLGHQLLALALGAKTTRLPFGHHGCNHPVKNLQDGTVQITSQNHNFVVVEETLDPNLATITHRSLNDHSVEGLAATTLRAFSLQYHPEAAPGPHDAAPAFQTFIREIRG